VKEEVRLLSDKQQRRITRRGSIDMNEIEKKQKALNE
jgi:hypothetical protein